MLIKYNKTNVHALGSKDGKVIYSIRPGWNEFPSNVWKQYTKDSEILRMIKNKEIELMTFKNQKTKKVLGQTDAEIHVTDMSEDDAIECVKGTFSRPMLQRWLDEETRHKVKRTIDKQLKPLLPESQTSTG